MPEHDFHAPLASHDAASCDNPSFRGRLWAVRAPDTRVVDALVAAGADALTAPILAVRGLDEHDMAAFFAPRLRDQLPNPDSFPGLAAGAEHLAEALWRGARIAIWSDYDVDGATAAAILADYLRRAGAAMPHIHIPDRIAEGYGPNADGLTALAEAGIETVVILDSGTVAFAPLRAAAQAGLSVIVVDHHAPEDALPQATALINPNLPDSPAGYGHLCAAGMTFLFVVALNLHLRRTGWFDRTGAVPPDLMDFLDLVALGTVCDVVPLTGLNRCFVMLGLPLLPRRARPGLAALAHAARGRHDIDPEACGYAIGPRLNAGGRIGPPDLAVHCLLETDPDTAQAQARELDRLNRARQEMERSCTQAALDEVMDAADGTETDGRDRRAAIAVVDAHEGVVGISAARVKDALDRPAFVLTQTGDGRLKGSGRSVPGFDLGAALHAARHAGIADKAGGHAMAGGVTLMPDALPAFQSHLDTAIAASTFGREGLTRTADAVLPPSRLSLGLCDAIERLGPFGMHHPRPTFLVEGLVLEAVCPFGTGHLRVSLGDPDRCGAVFDAVAFAAQETALEHGLHAAIGQRVDLLVTLSARESQGRRTLSIQIDDARPTFPPPDPDPANISHT